MRRPRKRTVVLAGAAVVLAAAAAFVFVSDNVLTVEGGAGATGPATDSAPMVAGVAELHNGGPWTVRVTSITSPTADLEFSLTPIPEGGGLFEPGELATRGDPVELAPGQSLYLWLALTTEDGNPTAVSTIDVHYSGLLGLPFTERSSVVSLLAYPSDLPLGVASLDDSEAAALDYVAAVRDALAERDYEALARVMGGGATVEDAERLSRQQQGVTEVTGFQASGEAPSWTASFSSNLPDFFVSWADFRWTLSS